MNTVIQAWVYRKTPQDSLEYLVMHRSEQDGGWWQPITGRVEQNDMSVTAAATREVYEEAGIQDFMNISDILYEYTWEHKGQLMTDKVLALEVANNSSVVLNPPEHQAFLWLSFTDALEKIKHDGNKESLIVVNRYITQD